MIKFTDKTKDDSVKTQTKAKADDTLTKELEETMHASDPPASTQPGGGITGAEGAATKSRDTVKKAPPAKNRGKKAS